MRALVHRGPTPTDALQLRHVPTPHAPEDGALVRVAVAAPNPVDWHLYRGEPVTMRLRRFGDPRLTRGIGEDFSGVVSEVAPGVRDLHVGQAVFGTVPALAQVPGTIAEDVPVSTRWAVPLPQGVDPVQAGTVGLVGLTALQALRDRGGLREGGRVLVWGASGGVGHMAVQIARLLGASRVDAVCSSRSSELVRGLGADEIFDYTADQDPVGPYDVMVDTVCTAGPAQVAALLAPGGTVVTIGALGSGRLLGPAAPMLRRMVGARLRGFTSRTVLTEVNPTDLALLGTWMESGGLRVTISETFTLDEAIPAYQRLEAGRVHGKLAIVADQSLVDDLRVSTR